MKTYNKEFLELGLCPNCNNILERWEFYKNSEVVYKELYDIQSKEWTEDNEPEIHHGEDYSINYLCDHCSITFHTSSKVFIENDDETPEDKREDLV